jgi:hypothetical protein
MADPDLSEFRALTNYTKQIPCQIVQVREELKGEEVKQLEAAMEAEPHQITNMAITKWLEVRGHHVIWQRVRQHRIGQCSCAKPF